LTGAMTVSHPVSDINRPSVAYSSSAMRLLDGPNYGMLGTLRPTGELQINPMWFERVGDEIRFTHTTTRGKYRNLRQNPTMTLAVLDPADPAHYVELRGRLVEALPDPTGDFYVRLARRYGKDVQQAPADSADRVILVMRIETVTAR